MAKSILLRELKQCKPQKNEIDKTHSQTNEKKDGMGYDKNNGFKAS